MPFVICAMETEFERAVRARRGVRERVRGETHPLLPFLSSLLRQQLPLQSPE